MHCPNCHVHVALLEAFCDGCGLSLRRRRRRLATLGAIALGLALIVTLAVAGP